MDFGIPMVEHYRLDSADEVYLGAIVL